MDIHAKRCQAPECHKRASFGFPGGKKQFCLQHKSADMVCYWSMCLLVYFVQAAFCNHQCMQDGVHCNSVLRCLQVNVANKRCQEPGCMKQPSFGFPGGKAQFCAEHMFADMVCHLGVRFSAALLGDRAVPIAAFATDGFVSRLTLTARAVKLPDAQRNLILAARAAGGGCAPSISWMAW